MLPRPGHVLPHPRRRVGGSSGDGSGVGMVWCRHSFGSGWPGTQAQGRHATAADIESMIARSGAAQGRRGGGGPIAVRGSPHRRWGCAILTAAAGPQHAHPLHFSAIDGQFEWIEVTCDLEAAGCSLVAIPRRVRGPTRSRCRTGGPTRSRRHVLRAAHACGSACGFLPLARRVATRAVATTRRWPALHTGAARATCGEAASGSLQDPADKEGRRREQSQGGHARPLTVEQQIDRPCPGGAARPTAEAVPNAPAAPRGQRRRSPCCQDPGVGPARPARGGVADGLRVLRGGAASTPRPAPQLRFAANGAVRQGGASPKVALQTAHACGGARDET